MLFEVMEGLSDFDRQVAALSGGTYGSVVQLCLFEKRTSHM